MTDCNCYEIYPGTLMRLSGKFVDRSNTPVDPTTVRVSIKLPDGSYVRDQVPTKDSVGNYHFDYLPTLSGPYSYQFTGTGAAPVSSQKSFNIAVSNF